MVVRMPVRRCVECSKGSEVFEQGAGYDCHGAEGSKKTKGGRGSDRLVFVGAWFVLYQCHSEDIQNSANTYNSGACKRASIARHSQGFGTKCEMEALM